MKTKTRISAFAFILLSISVAIFSCSEDDPITPETPSVTSAYIDTSTLDEVVVNFNVEIITNGNGFSIAKNDQQVNIVSVSGSNSKKLRFKVEFPFQYGDEVTISYNSSEGNANNDGEPLPTFNNKAVTNSIAETDFSVLLTTIPPDFKTDTVWLVVKYASGTPAWDVKDAGVNVTLSCKPDQTPFDIIVYLTQDPDWRPNDPFTTGYYASLLNSTNKYAQLKQLTWVKANSLSGTDMGLITDINLPVENTDYELAYSLLTSGMDYIEGNITDTNPELWYKFEAQNGIEYEITIKDNLNMSDYYSGVVEGVVCDEFAIPEQGVNPAIGGYPVTFTGEGKIVYVLVQKWHQYGANGNFHITVEAQ